MIELFDELHWVKLENMFIHIFERYSMEQDAGQILSGEYIVHIYIS